MNRLGRRSRVQFSDSTRSAFFWLSAFFVVYCARPEDWPWSSARDRAVAAGILPAVAGGFQPPGGS